MTPKGYIFPFKHFKTIVSNTIYTQSMKGFLNINIFITIVLFIGMLLMDFVGFKIRSYRNSKKITEYNTGLGPIEGALLGLLSLLLAFSLIFQHPVTMPGVRQL